MWKDYRITASTTSTICISSSRTLHGYMFGPKRPSSGRLEIKKRKKNRSDINEDTEQIYF